MPKSEPPTTVPASSEAPSRAAMPSGADREAMIRVAAYHLYERNGCRPGRALEDWIAAEMMIDAQLGSELAAVPLPAAMASTATEIPVQDDAPAAAAPSATEFAAADDPPPEVGPKAAAKSRADKAPAKAPVKAAPKPAGKAPAKTASSAEAAPKPATKATTKTATKPAAKTAAKTSARKP